ncbi:FAD-dependent oxidoreductase [Sciscionella marina]|uniref:FAD-dependent oxidoreductase n=1 Tax=Sciscionella marina TaxID=508770 RepID=UPI0003757DCA|nr:NAD(P)/FAD-dependent oxidoreductase [Sciscionella marina]
MPENTQPVLVIGGGTGGLALAHGLRQAGIPVQVYERDRHRTGGLQGFRVGISPNGVRALRDCLPPELFDTFIATTAKEYRYYTNMTEQLHPLLTISMDELNGPGTDEVIRDYSVSRMTLRQVLLTGLEDIVHFDKKFSHYTEDGDTVTAHFEDGSSASGGLLVGADGANSRVRKQLLPHAEHHDTGLIAIGGKLAITPENNHLLPGTSRQGMSIITDRRGTFGILHVMEFPWQDDREIKHGIGSSDAELLRDWPGLRFDNTTDYFSWGVSVPSRLAPRDVFQLSGEALQKYVVTELIHDWHPNLRALVRDSDPGASFALTVRTSEPVEAWRPSRITVLGDAAHTMTPGRGAGANTALRDSQVLRDRLVDHRDGTRDLVGAVGAYESAMREYSAVAVRESLENMKDYELDRKPVRRALFTAGMRAGMRLTGKVPAMKRRMVDSMQRTRDSERAG